VKCLKDSELIYLIAVASHMVLLTLVGVSAVIAFSNPTPRVNSLTIAMWSLSC
jgi:hypothetical protein